ncbi:3-isopropylmalate dehydrogenase [Acidaminobacter sp. JC074]|uniref:3-isopropylmalate dehydrogenase n=1 Tax=Acidaminobacter sp. JC074 TaxID=2530199 RepID=UPI001F0EDB0E|nr:3-isopropylmalate dehydrogenase [Acidaminobacter sp. JC074]MCH4890583.1 3-isopropylmalate dehydrogenase [Acidaminobacter sp. JC074]
MYKIAVLRGDGIGPEIVDQSLRVLNFIEEKYQLDFDIKYAHFGGKGIDEEGHPFPESTKSIVDWSDAVLLGAVGGPKWDQAKDRPEQGLLSLRKHLGAYCNLRPIITFEALKDMSPLKLDQGKNIDLCFVRELTGGIYFGKKERIDDLAYDQKQYETYEVKRIAKKAFELSKKRAGKICSVDKSNVLMSSKLWREEVEKMNETYQVDLNHMYVDNAAMQLIMNPYQFDVILTGNMFGDILSDEASVLAGSIGVLPSASIGDEKGLYEPIHGSAPDIAGQDIANPIGMIMSLAMMFQNSFERTDIYDFIYKNVNKTLEDGYGTVDLKLDRKVTTREWTDQLIKNMQS